MSVGGCAALAAVDYHDNGNGDNSETIRAFFI